MSAIKPRATMPRRTDELTAAQSTLKKLPLQRLSRLAQPLRKLPKPGAGHENYRSASCDRSTVFSYANVPQTPGTSQKLRFNSLSATPSNRTPLKGRINSATYSTVEKDKPPVENREWIMTQCERIFDHLETVPDLPKEFVERRNIKAMSTKQFLLIMNHLFKQIGGNRYKLGTNFIEDIMKTMAELEYPYIVNRSMLRTPNAPHSINHVIVLLGWLVQLAPRRTRMIPTLKRDSNLLEDFPNCEYQDLFFERVQAAFSLWNLKKMSEYESIVEQLTDKLVTARTDGLNQQETKLKISELEQEIQDLNNQPVQQGRQQSMDGLSVEFNEQEQMKRKLEEEVNKLLKQFNKIEKEHCSRQEEYESLVNNIETIKLSIEIQMMSATEKDEIINRITANKNLLMAKRLAVSTLQESCYEQQIVLSRAIKQKFNLLSLINGNVHQMQIDLKPMINFKVPTIPLRTENYAELLQLLQNIKSQLETVVSEQSSIVEELNEEKSNLEEQLSNVQIDLNTVENNLRDISAYYEQVQEGRKAIIDQAVYISTDNAQVSLRCQDEELCIKREIAELLEECELNIALCKEKSIELDDTRSLDMEVCRQILEWEKYEIEKWTDRIEDMEYDMQIAEQALGEEY